MDFYITISNGLLKDNHRKRMGGAVWEFMWLIDKVTQIDEQGFGWVLGGKSVKLKDLAMGTQKANTSKNLTRLAKHGYIMVKHAQYGLIIKVAKAQKRFNQKNSRQGFQNGNSDSPRVSKMETQGFQNDHPGGFQNDHPATSPNIGGQDNYIDKTVRHTATAKAVDPKNQIFEVFYKTINPTINFANSAYRKACETLIEKIGLEKSIKAAKYAVSIQNQKYAPVITNPLQLSNKYGELQGFYAKENKINQKNKHLIL
jgi:hypothetical protein